jgi:peptidoglycan/xylan/chitin deacetylase (PgdA/CDA1 family)
MNVDAWRIPEKEQSFGTTSNIGDFLRITNLEGNKSISATSTVNVDLSGSNIFLKMKVTNRPVIERLDLAFSTNGWKGYMVTSLKESYRDEYNGELLNITLGKGKERMGRGQWQEYGTGFDWSKIDQVRITLRTKANTTAAIQLLELSSTPMLKEGEVIIIFDDGYESILPAIKIMQQYGLKGNIAVIGDRVKNNERGYLSLKQLREIKDVYGWDLVNHSEHHVDAVTTYAKKRDIEGFENDLLSGAQFLEESGLNTAPNWYVYPHGATNAALKEVVGKYYTFARTTINQPETYPFGDPLTVKTISADGVESTGENVFIPINVIMGAVRDAKTFKLPLFITFHRIHGTVSDRPGYELENFRQLISQIAAQHIPVKTLRQFDADHGITEYPMSFTAPQPAQITLTIDSRKVVWWKRIKYVFHDMWIHIVTSVRTLYKKL